MAEQGLGKNILKKGTLGLVIGVLLFLGAEYIPPLFGAHPFPHVFKVMFFIYALLGAFVFILLDAPSMERLEGGKAVIGLVLFYTIISGVYIGGASSFPQYDPEVEKGKIEKLLKRKREVYLGQNAQVGELLTKVKSLEQNSDQLLVRLGRFAPASALIASSAVNAEGEAMPVVDRGREVYDLYECYNCHKIGGKGSVKKRGPVLDNIGSYLTVEDIKRKVLDPTYLYAEGFEKEHKKGRMPDKYKDLMMEEEINALGVYLSTLKDASVETPKPVFVKSNVEHGFTVFGYVRDKGGTPLTGIEVHAAPQKKGGHGSSGKTNDSGYYEIFIHMHNEDAGTRVEVSAQSTSKEFVAEYDPNDKVTKRQKSIDLVISSEL